MSNQADNIDYALVLDEFGLSAEVVRSLSEHETDQVPFPRGGAYKVAVGQSNIEGTGLIAITDIDAGEIIAPARIEGMRTPAGRYTNHAKMPNAKLIAVDNGDIYVRTLRPIIDGEEITVDYREAAKLNIATQVKCKTVNVSDEDVRVATIRAFDLL